MTFDKTDMFRNRLVKVYRHLSRQAKRLQVSSYRIYDHDLPEFPLCIELYGDKVYVAEYKRHHGMTETEHDEWMDKSLAVIAETTGRSKENIYLKLRQRKPGRLGQYQKQAGRQEEIIVEENGLKFLVNLTDYLDTGLFLDHRITRELVRKQSAGKKVLNLFAYTGSFSVYAASGGAAEVVTADLSKTYLTWAQKNMELNGFTDTARYHYIQADVKQYLDELPAACFDIIVMDPPTFSNSKRMQDILDIQRDHPALINKCLEALRKEGKLYFSNNARKFVLEKEKIYPAEIKDITRLTTPFDFEGKLARWCFEITRKQ